MPVRPGHFHRCTAIPASSRTRPSGSRSRARNLVLSRGPGGALGRQHGWTCIFVAFLLLPSGNDPGSPVVWAAHWCFSVRSLGPETAHVRLASVRQRAPSWLMLSHSSFFYGNMICATPYIVMWDKKSAIQRSQATSSVTTLQINSP